MGDPFDLLSPRLRSLQEALTSGTSDALPDFWREISEEGAPLIEPIEGDDHHSLVTFLWRSSESNSVSLISLLTNPTTYPMTRLLDTDLWYTSSRVRKNVRATYQFSVVDPGQPVHNASQRWVTWRPDPLNPKIFAFHTNEEDPTGVRLERSILEMEEAPEQPWCTARENLLPGKVTLHQLRNKILNNKRRVWVYTPPSYNANRERAYALLILFDGWGYLHLMPTTTILDNLISKNRIDPLITVFVDSLSTETRMRELIYHDPFNEFLVTELLPWVRDSFHVTSVPGQIILGGSSAGGLAAVYAALRYPGAFGNVLSQSGAFRLIPPGEEEFGWLANQFTNSDKLPLRFHIDIGLLEENSLRDLGDGPTLLQSTRDFRDVLQDKDYDLHYTEASGGHDYISWQGTLPEGLQALLASPTD